VRPEGLGDRQCDSNVIPKQNAGPVERKLFFYSGSGGCMSCR
jgi:hypothetical protein